MYDLCFRILGSQVDAADATRETFVGVLRGAPSLLASARDACHRRLDLPGVAAHEREVLALSELEHLSYEEIAEIMGIDWDSVAQLHDWALAPEAEQSEDCERALPLIALEQDGGLAAGSNDAGWLEEHLMHCRSCRAARDAVREADRYEPAPTRRRRLRHLTVAAGLVSVSVVALWVAVSHEGPLALIVPAMEEEPAAAPPKPAAAENPEPPAEPAGARAGKKAARQKGPAERRDAKRSPRERRARKQRAARRRADRARRMQQRRANRARRPARQERTRRPRTGGNLAPPPKPERERPPRQSHVERRPDRDGRDALVPAPSPAPPPSETAPDQPTPAPPSG